VKIKWKVQEAPTGRFKSFHYRGWPLAETETGDVVFGVDCKDDYVPAKVKSGNHEPLRLRVAVRNNREVGFDWATLKRDFATLSELKEAAKEFATRRPEVFVNKK
jgi:hypothetical protein